jgi:uncharacterized beta-barrel protein YwiB (DUF1934 family)
MKRYGSGIILDTVMEFKKGQRFNSLYETPYGSVPMEVLTYKIVNDLKPDEGKGNLFIDYEVSLKGLSESRSLLNIEVSPTQMC